jgi:hypothetical protein
LVVLYFVRSESPPEPQASAAAVSQSGEAEPAVESKPEPAPSVAPSPVTLPDAPQPAPPPADRPLEDVVALVLPGVVSVQTERGGGSGFFAAPGAVITNYHVVQGSRSVLVKVGGLNSFRADVERVSADTDLALLRVESGAWTPIVLELGSASEVRPGQEVVAVGSALGVLESTVTRGIVSAVRTEGPVTLLQTDAAINPGNSGGPLLNRRGEVIGITTLKLKPAESIGFAVAADHAKLLLAGGGVPPSAVSTVPTEFAPGGAPSLPGSQRSDSDLRREEATRRFDNAVRALVSTMKNLQMTLDTLESQCVGRRSAGGSLAQTWSPPWTGPMMSNESGRRQCAQWARDVSSRVEDIKRRMAEAEEDARRAAVYPGTLREIRRKYGMEW